MKLKNTFLLLLSLTIITSCLNKKDSSDSSAVDPIIGTWTLDCSRYYGSLTFNEDYSSQIIDNGWDDQNCTTKIMQDTVTTTYTKDASSIIYTVTKHELTLFDSTKITNANNSSLCGITNWTIGLPQNITGLTCDITTYSSNYTSPKVNGEEWTCTYTIDGNQLTACTGDTYSK